jgi:hypothetical protein
MKLKEYLTEATMPKEQLDYFKEIISSFRADHKGFKADTPVVFMKALERNDYKSLSVLFGDLGLTSITQFVSKYKDTIISNMNESKDYSNPKDKARKAKLDKIVKIKSARAEYARGEYVVELIGDKWPSDADLIFYADYPSNAPFGGRVSKGTGNTKIVSVHTD